MNTFLFALLILCFVALPLSILALISLCRISKLADEDATYWKGIRGTPEEMARFNRFMSEWANYHLRRARDTSHRDNQPGQLATPWARKGFDPSATVENARTGCLVGQSKSSRQNETITSFLWTSAVKAVKSLWQRNNRQPFAVGCSLPLAERRSEQSAVSSVRNLTTGGGSNNACKSGSSVAIGDAGSIPAASTNHN